MITPVGLVASCISIPKKSDLLGGGAIWWPYVYVAVCMCCGIFMACVMIEATPGFCGRVESMYNCGASLRRRAARHALRS